jgi:hypothetical protein
MEKDVKQWLSRIEELKKGSMDLSIDEDLSIAIMNLISLEEHFYFSAMKSNDNKYLDMLKSVREMRKKLLGKIVKTPKAEEWCISKHLLASSMRLIEVGTKELSRNNNKEAESYFKNAFDLYSLFFAINLNLIQSKEIKKENLEKFGFMNKFSEAVKKMVDCCRE